MSIIEKLAAEIGHVPSPRSLAAEAREKRKREERECRRMLAETRRRPEGAELTGIEARVWEGRIDWPAAIAVWVAISAVVFGIGFGAMWVALALVRLASF